MKATLDVYGLKSYHWMSQWIQGTVSDALGGGEIFIMADGRKYVYLVKK